MKRAILFAVGLAGVLACSADGDDTAAMPAPCDAGRTACDKACVAVETDARNCGACGAACGDGQRCSGGVCGCDDGQAACGGHCTDVSSSATDCGACGHACKNAESCVAGTCDCIGEAIACGGACVDPRTDAKLCGATAGCGDASKGSKGTACSATQTCLGGACTPCVDFALAGYAEVSPYTTAIGFGDFDGDGKIDLVTSGPVVDILKGHGDGTFSPMQRIAQTTQSGTIPVADLDGDGHLDFVLVNTIQDASFNNLGVVGIFYGRGDGSFDPAPNLVKRAADRYVFDVAIGDMDKDGRKDLVIVDPFLPAFGVARATGARTYAAWVDTSTGPGTQQPDRLALGDLNGDGSLDVVVANDAKANSNDADHSSSIDAVLRTGTMWAAKKTFMGGQSSRAVALADLNGDGRLDAMTADGPGVSLFFGNGDGTFAATTSLLSYSNSASIVPVDLDGDGVMDLVIGGGRLSTDNPRVDVRIGVGNGSFYPPLSFDGGAAGVTVADVNGDGRPDLLVADYVSSGKVAVYLSTKRASCP